jgi:hypothetical protein
MSALLGLRVHVPSARNCLQLDLRGMKCSIRCPGSSRADSRNQAEEILTIDRVGFKAKSAPGARQPEERFPHCAPQIPSGRSLSPGTSTHCQYGNSRWSSGLSGCMSATRFLTEGITGISKPLFFAQLTTSRGGIFKAGTVQCSIAPSTGTSARATRSGTGIGFRVSPRGLARTRVRVPARRGKWGRA